MVWNIIESRLVYKYFDKINSKIDNCLVKEAIRR